MTTIEKLVEVFKEFPGIGERQAKRFVYFLMSRTNSYSSNLSELLKDLKREVARCGSCFRFFLNDSTTNTQNGFCNICSNDSVDLSTLMIVEKDGDLDSVEKSKVYPGKYFVLGGLVPIVEKNTTRRIRLNELLQRIKKDKGLKEIILAFSLSPEGNHTDFYIREQINELAKEKNLKISSLGRGLSTGTELEYSDNDTLKNALTNRQ